MVLDLYALHVLAANVQYAVHFGIEEGGRIIVRDGLHLPVVQEKGGFDQCLPVARGAGPDYPHALWHELVDLLDRVYGGLQGRTVVIRVEGVEEPPVPVDEGAFRGCGPGVYPEEDLPPVGREVPFYYAGFFMPLLKGSVFFLTGEEGPHPGDLKVHMNALAQSIYDRAQCHRTLPGVQGASDCGEEVGVLWVYNMLVIQLQCTDEGSFKLCQEVQRPPQEGHVPPYRLPAGQAADGLIHDGLEDGGREVLLCRALVYQGLDIRLRKDAAPGRYRIEGLVILCVPIKPLGIGL